MLEGECEPGVPLTADGGDTDGRYCRECGLRWHFKHCPRCGGSDIWWFSWSRVPCGHLDSYKGPLYSKSEKRLRTMVEERSKETGMDLFELLMHPCTSKKARRVIIKIMRELSHTF